MKRFFSICLMVIVGNALLTVSGTIAASGQSSDVLVGKPTNYNAAIHSFVARKDLAGLEQLGRQVYSDWVGADPSTYSNLMLKIANAFGAFPIVSDSSKILAIEFLELSVRRTSELELQEELFLVGRRRQDWDRLAKIMPAEVINMREFYAARMLTAWQRADDAWDQIKDRPIIMPVSTHNLLRVPQFAFDASGTVTRVEHVPTPEEKTLEEARMRNYQEASRDYNFHVGLMNNRADYTNVVAVNLAWAFSQIPRDFGRLAALTEQHLKKPESRDAFYAVAARGLPAHLLPQFQAVVRETQERRKAHLRTPSVPMIREHTNRPFASPAARGSNPVPNQTAGKQVPAARTPIIAAASPAPSASEAAQSTSPRSLPYLPLASVLAAGLVLWWFISRSRPG